MFRASTSSTLSRALSGVTVLLCLYLASPGFAESSDATRADLFVIERNKNKNLVQYAVRLDAGCRPVGDAPIEVFWRMLEVGPKATEAIGLFEQMAYGIKSQVRRSAETELHLEALPEKRLRVRSSKASDGACVAEVYTPVQGGEARLTRIYVQADEGALLPSVRYIEVTAIGPDGVRISERLAP